ncbi:hypothetical protein ACLQ2Q_15660 [Microbacterium sp. DT81.1]|uniref:hypothetical protein n=1 Tax=Microbacterium sp. DT81.1 TaxID=3393413 RepID=UPI003CE9C02E
MTVLLFVHGTSVRESGHDATLATIKKHVDTLDRGWTVETCYWGTVFGAALTRQGVTVPGYVDTRRRTAQDDEDDDVALWSVLYADPLYELRILGLKPSGPPPFGEPPSVKLLRATRAFRPSPDSRDFFQSFGLAEFLDSAVAAVAVSSELADAAVTAQADPVEHRQAIARAVVAETLVRAEMAGVPAVSGWMRDRLVQNIASDLQADVLGVSDWLRKATADLVAGIATHALLAHRGTLTDAATPSLGDILRFLARHQEVEDYLTTRIKDLADPDVYLLGHSLGGIICVDLLARSIPGSVRGLITVGSQAPYFHEIGALPSLAPGGELPASMPPWLNIYDPRDILSYVGQGVFGKRITDVEVNGKEPFPQSHSAYWNTPAVWESIAEFVKK